MKCHNCGGTLTGSERGLKPCPKCLLRGAADTFAGLELLEPIGEGGMGTVYRARHVELDRVVAVKFLSPTLAQRPELKERFTKEARALAKVTHRNVVQIFDAGEEDGEAYLVMEYVGGGTLAARVPMSAREAVTAMKEVCDAVSAVHDAGLVHRDIKPENVLLSSTGEIKLSDFGIVRDTKDEARTAPGLAMGTPGFVSPEVHRGEAASVRSDVYAMGAMLRALITGSHSGGEAVAMDSGVEALVRRAMSSEASARFESAREFHLALNGLTLEEDGALPADEQLWSRAVALAMTVAFAAGAWASVVSLTPRVHSAGDVPPMVALGMKTLADGRIFTVARFETAWVLAAVACFAVALAAVGALRQHWRTAGLLTSRPSGPLPYARTTFVVGALALLSYLARRLWLGPEALAYVPLGGGAVLLAVTYFASLARLEAWRRQRRILNEPAWILGVIAGAVPPVVDGLKHMLERAAP